MSATPQQVKEAFLRLCFINMGDYSLLIECNRLHKKGSPSVSRLPLFDRIVKED